MWVKMVREVGSDTLQTKHLIVSLEEMRLQHRMYKNLPQPSFTHCRVSHGEVR